MTGRDFSSIFFLKTLIFCIFFGFAPINDASAKLKPSQCSGEGQPPCPAIYKGPICDKGLGKINGKCRRCGGEGQQACPRSAKGKPCHGGRMKIDGFCYAKCGGPNQKACAKIKSGYPCRGSFEPDNRGFCKPCGGNGQKACRALKAGKQCDNGLTKISGICQSCGGRNERACPKLAGGYPCKGKLEPDNRNICQPCGGNAQKACRALKAGKQCDRGLTKINGICQSCGGPNERACPKLASGYPCRGQFAPDRQGICKPCGGAGQTACRVLKAGRQCAPGTTARGGICVSCGGEGQRACKITDRGKPCEPGLKRGLNGFCKISVEAATKRAALAELETVNGDILPAMTFAVNLNRDKGLKDRIRNEETTGVPDNNLCPGGNYQSWTLGVSGEAGAIVNVEGEAGAAFRCADHARGQKDSKWYSSGSFNFRAGGGASAGISIGMWKDAFNRLRGKSHGYSLDVVDAFQAIKAAKAKDFLSIFNNMKQVEPDLSLAMWFERRDEDGDGKDDEVGRFLGFTVTVGAAVGADVTGGAYIAATTTQFCTDDLKCTEGSWRGTVGGQRTTINVDGQQKQFVFARINGGPRTKFDRVLPAGRKYKSDDGDILRFRKNYKLLKFESSDGAKGELKLRNVAAPANTALSTRQTRPARPVSRPARTAAVSGINAVGLWDVQVQGGTVTEEFVRQTDQILVVRRQGTTENRQYRKTAENQYSSPGGGTFRFVSNTRALWISDDKSAVFQLNRR